MNEESLRELVNQSGVEQHAQILAGHWWHSIDLGSGHITPGVHSIEELQDNYRRFQLPDDLRGKRILDLGCWDGFYAFEAERHGAEVVAVDCWRPENFFVARAMLGSRIEFHELSVYEVTRERLGAFDIVLFLGVLYHLRHPLLALEQICEVTREVAVIESHMIDGLIPTERPVMEFYEFDELGGQYDNWWGPNTICLERMLRTAGFARTEVLRRESARVVIKAYRSWEKVDLESEPSLEIISAVNAVTLDPKIPRRGRQAFLDLSVVGLPIDAPRELVRVTVGGFGVQSIFVGASGDPRRAGSTQINVPIPPGLDPGPTTVRVGFKGRWSLDYKVTLIEGEKW